MPEHADISPLLPLKLLLPRQHIRKFIAGLTEIAFKAIALEKWVAASSHRPSAWNTTAI